MPSALVWSSQSASTSEWRSSTWSKASPKVEHVQARRPSPLDQFRPIKSSRRSVRVVAGRYKTKDRTPCSAHWSRSLATIPSYSSSRKARVDAASPRAACGCRRRLGPAPSLTKSYGIGRPSTIDRDEVLAEKHAIGRASRERALRPARSRSRLAPGEAAFAKDCSRRPTCSGFPLARGPPMARDSAGLRRRSQTFRRPLRRSRPRVTIRARPFATFQAVSAFRTRGLACPNGWSTRACRTAPRTVEGCMS